MMEILVKVQIDLSEDTQKFISSFLGKGEVARPKPKDENADSQPVATKAVPVPAAKVSQPAATKAVVTPTTKTTQPALAISIEDVRKAVAPLVENFRSEIMQKLKEHKATSVSTLDSANYEAFVTYLNTLK